MSRLSLFRSSVPKHNTGLVIATVGFLTMAVGGRYIANALSAGKKAATRQLNPDGSKSLFFACKLHMCTNQ